MTIPRGYVDSCEQTGAPKKITIVSRPDTDKIEKDWKAYYSQFENLEFRECPECAAQPGMPDLCKPCLHNRTVIQTLRNKYEILAGKECRKKRKELGMK